MVGAVECNSGRERADCCDWCFLLAHARCYVRLVDWNLELGVWSFPSISLPFHEAPDFDDFAEDGTLTGSRDDGGVVGILGVEFEAFPADAQTFDGGFVFHEGDHDIAGISGRLGADDDNVVFQNAGVDHAVTPDFEAEQILRSRWGMDGDVSFEIFNRGAEDAGLDAAEDGDSDDRHGCFRQTIAACTAAFGKTAFGDELFQMLVRGLKSLEAEGLLHFPNGGRLAGLELFANVSVDLFAGFSGFGTS